MFRSNPFPFEPSLASGAELQKTQRFGPPFFLITIDTEGDNIWSAPREITTRNSQFLKRFQDLCEEFALKPTYLVNYEMAMCPEFRRFGRDVLLRNVGEIGMHLHGWNAPPVEPIAPDDYHFLPFLIEYSAPLMRAKIAYQTKLLADIFSVQPISHRAGRWALDSRYVELLLEHGYGVDCSVTPGISWRMPSTASLGCKGTDYRKFPSDPYWIDPADISRPGKSALLEVPMTIYRDTTFSWVRPRMLRCAANRVWPDNSWLRPTRRNLRQLLMVVRQVLSQRKTYAEFMLHSSEFMPGGSRTFKTKEDIEKLYSDLKQLFSVASQRFTGATLKEFSEWYRKQACGEVRDECSYSGQTLAAS